MICPLCNVSEMVPVWYGTPTLNELLLASQDQIALGGPRVKEYSHYCYQCQETYPQSQDY
jgi:hypothetical protein